VERNFKQLQALHQFVSIIISLGKQFAIPNRKQLIETVMAATVNWLTSMRMFLDHEETHLKRQFGESSAEFAAFKAATVKAYDNEVGYRFAYEFRNYVQHCGLPVNQVDITSPAISDNLITQDIKLLLDRDTLLAQFHKWKRVKLDLQAMRAKFELLPLLEDAMTGIRAVNRVCMDLDFDKALAAVPILAAGLERLDGFAGEPMLFRYKQGPQSASLTPRPLHASAVRHCRQ